MSLFDETIPARSTPAVHFARSLLGRLALMRAQEELCDFRIDVNGKQFSCHKFLLMATSDYFKALFTGLCRFLSSIESQSVTFRFLGQMNDSQSDHIELKGFEKSADGVEAMIHFCYSGSLSITFDNIDQLLHAGTHLQITEAVELCCNFLLQSCFISNCIDVHKIADLYSLTAVLDSVRSFISKNFLRLLLEAREQFDQLNYDQIRQELQRDTLDMHGYDEYHVFTMICRWIEANRGEREKHALDLFPLVRFMLISPEQLTDEVRGHALIQRDERSRTLVEDALCFYALPKRQPLNNDIQCRIRNQSALVAIGEVELFTLNTTEGGWETLCQAPLEENYPVSILLVSVDLLSSSRGRMSK